MAYYINKRDQQQKAQKAQEDQKNGKPGREMKFFYQLFGAVIVLIIFMIVWAVRGG